MQSHLECLSITSSAGKKLSSSSSEKGEILLVQWRVRWQELRSRERDKEKKNSSSDIWKNI